MATAIDADVEDTGTITKLLSSERPLTLVGGDQAEDQAILPEKLRRLLKQIVEEMEKGNDVAVMAAEADMTTQEAAEYLKVSRAYLVKVIDRGEIPSRLVGNHRRVKVKDVLLYEKSMNERK